MVLPLASAVVRMPIQADLDRPRAATSWWVLTLSVLTEGRSGWAGRTSVPLRVPCAAFADTQVLPRRGSGSAKTGHFDDTIYWTGICPTPDAGRSTGVFCFLSLAAFAPFPRFAGVTEGRSRRLGANTPWKRV
jgi:hypothetical protein